MTILFLVGALAPLTGRGDVAQLTVEWGTDKETYAPGGRVRIHLALVNTGARPVTLTLPDSCGFRFLVKDANGTPVGPEVLACAQVLVEVDFAPFERKVYALFWDHANFTGSPVPPGVYTVIFAYPSLTREVQITLRPQ